MKLSNTIKWAGCAAGALALSVTASGQMPGAYKPPVPAGFARMDADEIQTGTIFGDPSKPGIYVTRNLFRKGPGGGQIGSGSRPHYHDRDRWVTVIKGTWWTAVGDLYEPDKMVPIKQGGMMFHPAGLHHYDGSKAETGDVTVQIMGPGPVQTIQTEVDAQGNPVSAGAAGAGGAGAGGAGGARGGRTGR